MNKQFDDLLCENFPNLYRKRHDSSRTSCMIYGFPEDGWFLLIWNLSQNLEKMILEFPENKRHIICAEQVKEKFGYLRFYMSGQTQEMQDLIDKYQIISGSVCEFCGIPGKLRKDNWIKCLCDECYKNKYKI